MHLTDAIVMFNKVWIGKSESNHDTLGEESVNNLYYFYIIASIRLKASSAKSRRIVLTRASSAKKPVAIRPRGRERTTSIVAKSGTHAAVCIDLRGMESHALHVVLQQGAELSLFTLSGGKKQSAITQTCMVAAGARLLWWNITRENVRQSLDIQTSGAKADADVRWIAHARQRERQELGVEVKHLARNGSGDVQVRCLSEDQGSILVRGSVVIGKKAKGTEAFMDLRSLILDPKAQSKAIPAITVETNDVKAGHSATVSRIHPEDLFYLESRGLSPKQARKLFVEGFLKEI